MGCIYIIENVINHKKYIGQTTKKLSKRVSKNLKSHTRDNKKLKYDVDVYGLDAFVVKEVLRCENYKLDYYEKWFILLYNCCKDASTELGCKSNAVGAVCRGEQKTAKGYHFKYC